MTAIEQMMLTLNEKVAALGLAMIEHDKAVQAAIAALKGGNLTTADVAVVDQLGFTSTAIAEAGAKIVQETNDLKSAMTTSG